MNGEISVTEFYISLRLYFSNVEVVCLKLPCVESGIVTS